MGSAAPYLVHATPSGFAPPAFAAPCAGPSGLPDRSAAFFASTHATSSAAQGPLLRRYRVDRWIGNSDFDMDEERSVGSDGHIAVIRESSYYEDIVMKYDSQYAISSSGLSDGERTPTQNRQRDTESVASDMEVDVVESCEHEQQAGSEDSGGSVHLGVGETGREGAQGAPSGDYGGVERNKSSEDEKIQPRGSNATRPATTVRGTAAASTSASTPLFACTRAASVLDKSRRDPEVIDDGERFERDVTSLEILFLRCRVLFCRDQHLCRSGLDVHRARD